MTEPRDTPDDIEVAVLASGTRLGKYEIARQLGAGGMGAVYEATHTEIGKRVAIKVLSPAIAAIPGARARFLREAQLTSKIRHPNIVDVADMGNDGGQTYIVMELLAGEDLAGRLQRGPLSAAELADVMLPVCAAVVAAHRAGVTHRDLKPQNIFLARGPHGVQPKVLDFGISKGGDSTVGAGTLTGTGSIIGTPYYFAPEQIVDARAAGPGTDQYALGVIMYECLTGRRPYEGDTLFVVFQTIVNGAAVAPRAVRPDLPAALEAVVLRAMHVDPKQRFASTDGLGRALLPFASARQRSIWEDAFEASAAADASVNASLREAAATTPWQPGSAPTTPWRPVVKPSPADMAMATPRPPPVVTPQPPPASTPMPRAARLNTFELSGSANQLFDVAPPARSGKRKLVIAVVAFGVASGVGFLAMRPSGERAPQASAPAATPPAATPPPAVTPAPAPAATSAGAPAAAEKPPRPPVAPPAAVTPAPAAADASRPAAHPVPHTRPHARPGAPAPAPASAPAPRALNPNAAPVVD